MKKLFTFFVIILISFSYCFGEGAEKPTAQYNGEIKFQEVEWGSNDKEAVDTLVSKGIISGGYFSGSGAKPCFYWPEEDIDLQTGNTLQLMPQIIRENGWAGCWKLQYKPLKTIGGHDADAVFLHFTGNIGKSKIREKCDNLVAISFSFESKSTEVPIPEMFVDLLTKLTEQYGEFEIYYNGTFTNEYFKEISGATSDELFAMLSPLSSSINSYNPEFGITAFAVIHGENNTGIAIRWLNASEIELIYAKTDNYLHIEEMKKFLEEIAGNKEDAGL